MQHSPGCQIPNEWLDERFDTAALTGARAATADPSRRGVALRDEAAGGVTFASRHSDDLQLRASLSARATCLSPRTSKM